MLLTILLAVFIVSALSLVGVVALVLKKDFLEKITFFLVSFAAGGLLGAVFFDILPEAVEILEDKAFFWVLFGIIFFFLIEKMFFWYHCHHGKCATHHKTKNVKSFTFVNLVGDGIHNFVDGVVIAAAFLSTPGDLSLGIVTTLAVILHEIPQEIGDFGILIHGGYSRARALMFNFLFALTAVAGALLTYLFTSLLQNIEGYLLALAAGNFIYLACTDLLPELHHEENMAVNLKHFLVIMLGIVVVWLSTSLLAH
ncbi:MAG: ZIP family metal transporter [Nanoarchaeota archaeon]